MGDCYEPSSLISWVHEQVPFVEAGFNSTGDSAEDLLDNLNKGVGSFYDYFLVRCRGLLLTEGLVVSESVSNNSPRNPVSDRSTDEAMTSRDLLCISPLSNVSNNDLLSSPPSQPSSNSSAHMASLAGSSSD